ncbi:MAG: hypothetical protein PGN07_02695 [Aeromicrobium erythreum]
MTSPTVPPVSRTRIVVSVLAVVGTLPYLGLKLLWLTGSRVGLKDPDFGRSATMHAVNAATFVMDAVAIVLAVALVTGLRHRLPTPVLLAPLWVATGLLAPILVIVPLQVVVGVPESSGAAAGAIADWVYALVYAGFLWQGTFLLLGLVLFCRERWRSVAGRPAPAAPATSWSWLAGALLLVAAIALVLDALDRPAVAWPNLAGDLGALAVAGLGLALLHRGGSRRAVVATTLWVGSGATLTWGLYQLLLVVVPNDLVAASDVSALDVAAPATRLAAGLAVLLALVQARAAARRLATSPTRKIPSPATASAAPTRLGAR